MTSKEVVLKFCSNAKPQKFSDGIGIVSEPSHIYLFDDNKSSVDEDTAWDEAVKSEAFRNFLFKHFFDGMTRQCSTFIKEVSLAKPLVQQIEQAYYGDMTKSGFEKRSGELINVDERDW